MRTPISLSEQFTLGLINNFVSWQLKEAKSALAARGIVAPRLLDVGCGRQPYRILVKNLGYHYSSMDISARDVQLDIEAALDDRAILTKFLGAQFDVLLITEVLEHVDGQETAWSNLAHLVSLGGRLIITAPFLYPLHEEPWDACRPSYHQISRFAQQNGFNVILSLPAGGVSAVIGVVLANVHVKKDQTLAKRIGAHALWVLFRCTSKFLSKFPILDLLTTKFYVENLVVCEKVK